MLLYLNILNISLANQGVISGGKEESRGLQPNGHFLEVAWDCTKLYFASSCKVEENETLFWNFFLHCANMFPKKQSFSIFLREHFVARWFSGILFIAGKKSNGNICMSAIKTFAIKHPSEG